MMPCNMHEKPPDLTSSYTQEGIERGCEQGQVLFGVIQPSRSHALDFLRGWEDGLTARKDGAG